MLYHLQSSLLPGGFVGVDVFFVISGFVVTASLVHHQESSLGTFIAGFYARRMARILPALLTTLVLSALFATLLIPKAWLSQLSDETALRAFFGLSNWTLQHNTDFYFSPRAEFNPYTHTWSLGVEEQFYVIVPILLFFWARHNSAERNTLKNIALGILGALCVASLATLIWASKHDPAMAFYFIGARFWELGLGAILFLQTQNAPKPSSSLALQKFREFAPYIGVIALGFAFIKTDPKAFPWPWALLSVIATILIIGGARASTTNGVRRVLSNAAFVWIGKRSYSLYLWHWPVYVLLRWTIGLESTLTELLALAITLVLATLSYQLIEQPCRQSTWLKSRSKIVQIILFALITVGCFHATKYMFRHAKQISISKVTRNPMDWYGPSIGAYPEMAASPCEVQTTLQPFHGGNIVRIVPIHCKISVSKNSIYVLGDSHAAMFTAAFTQLSADQAIAIDLYSFAGCSYINFKAPMQGQFSKECMAFNEAMRSNVANNAKPGDLVILSSLRMNRYTDQWANFDIPDMHQAMYNEQTRKLRQEALEDAYQWITPFTQNHIKTLFIGPAPIFKAPTFRCADWFNHSNPICVGNNEQSREELVQLRTPIIKAIQQIAATNSLVYLWDPFPILCPDSTCSTMDKDRPLFFDGDHISNYGNFVLYPSLSKAISQIQK